MQQATAPLKEDGVDQLCATFGKVFAFEAESARSFFVKLWLSCWICLNSFRPADWWGSTTIAEELYTGVFSGVRNFSHIYLFFTINAGIGWKEQCRLFWYKLANKFV